MDMFSIVGMYVYVKVKTFAKSPNCIAFIVGLCLVGNMPSENMLP